MKWIPLESIEQVEEMAAASNQKTCIIFKHSTACNMSAMAKWRLEEEWAFEEEEVAPYCVDVLQHKAVSNFIASYFQEYHESPQLLVVQGGEVTYEETRLDISVEGIKEMLQ